MGRDEFAYVGTELQVFAQARRWKAYLAAQVQPFLGGSVLEVGAGVGATAAALCRRPHERWVCLEPDPRLAAEIRALSARGALPSFCEVVVGSLDEAALGRFDTILYIDVLEHIEDDHAELARAAQYLAPGGHLVVLSPAHPWLFSAFDRAIGHHRRYTAATLRAAAPAGLTLVRLRFLDSVGVVSSAANRLLLNQQMPTPGQIRLWDTLMIPTSRCVDPLVRYRFGRTLLAVWKNEPAVKAPAHFADKSGHGHLHLRRDRSLPDGGHVLPLHHAPPLAPRKANSQVLIAAPVRGITHGETWRAVGGRLAGPWCRTQSA